MVQIPGGVGRCAICNEGQALARQAAYAHQRGISQRAIDRDKMAHKVYRVPHVLHLRRIYLLLLVVLSSWERGRC